MYFDIIFKHMVATLVYLISVPEHTTDDQKGLESLFVMNLVDS